MKTISDTERALLEAAQQLPIAWLNKTPDTNGIRQQLCAAAQQLQGIKGEPEISAIQSDLLATAYANELPLIFLRSRAQESMARLTDLTLQRFSDLAAPPEEEATVPVRVYRRSWGNITHIYRVEPVELPQADDMLLILPGDLFEVLEARETPGSAGSHTVLSLHLTLAGANAEANRATTHPRLVRLVTPTILPITACADNGAEIVVSNSTTYTFTPWEQRLEQASAPGAIAA